MGVIWPDYQSADKFINGSYQWIENINLICPLKEGWIYNYYWT